MTARKWGKIRKTMLIHVHRREIALRQMLTWNFSCVYFACAICNIMNNALNSHGLEQWVSHKRPLRDGFDIVVMEAPENIKTCRWLYFQSVCFGFGVFGGATKCVCEWGASHMSRCTCRCTAEEHLVDTWDVNTLTYAVSVTHMHAAKHLLKPRKKHC